MAGTGLKASFITGLTDVDSTDREGVGALRLEGNSWYKYVKFLNDTATVALVQGDVVAYAALTGYGASVVVGDLTDADARPIAAGVAWGTVAGVADTGYFGWIKIKGPATIPTAIESSNDGTPVAAGDGDPAQIGDADTTLRRVNTTHDADTERGVHCAVIIDASAKTVILDCPF